MNIIRLRAQKNRLLKLDDEYLAAASREYVELRFELDADWAEVARTVAVNGTNGESYHLLMADDWVTVPLAAMEVPGVMSVGLLGVQGDLRITTNLVPLKVLSGSATEGQAPPEPEPTVYEQIVSELADHENRINVIEIGGGGGGTADHRELLHLDSPNQHPISAITGLQDALDSIETIVGPEGPAGPMGPQGPQGVQGPAGPEGPQGPIGETGPAGEQGPQGPAGVDGADGAEGPQGEQGPAGADGAQGPIGPEGPQGPAGADGADGLTTSVNGVEHVAGNVSITLDDVPDGAVRVLDAGGASTTYPRGSAFPASPTNGDAFYRTDRKILYVYEGTWHPIESYGDITLYLSSTGNDANDCFSPATAAASLQKVWACIPRLYGGNVTVVVSGEIVYSASIDLELGGKYAVGGAYIIKFIGIEGAVAKSAFVGTVDESVAANRGVISGLGGLATDAFMGKLLKNVTRDWETTIHGNTSSAIKSVGIFNRAAVLQYGLMEARTVAGTDTWEVREFGASIAVTSGRAIRVNVPVEFERLLFKATTVQTIANYLVGNQSTTVKRCSFIGDGVGIGALFLISTPHVLQDVMQVNGVNLFMNAQSSASLWVFGFGVYATGRALYIGNGGASILFGGFITQAPSIGTATAITVVNRSSLTFSNCNGSILRNYPEGVKVQQLSTAGTVGQLEYDNVTTPTVADAATFAFLT